MSNLGKISYYLDIEVDIKVKKEFFLQEISYLKKNLIIL